MSRQICPVLVILLVLLLSYTTVAQTPEWDWAVGAGGTDWDVGHSLAVDSAHNSIISGYFSGTAAFGDTTLTSAGSWDIFVAKYNSNGSLLWVQQAGGTSGDIGWGTAVDGTYNSIVTGWFEGTAIFGDTTLTSAGESDIFVAKCDASGNWLWAVQAGGIGEDRGWGITMDGTGKTIVTGSFSGTATFGDTMLTSAGESDIFLAKYDSSGNLLWVQQAGGTGEDWGGGIAVDGESNSVISGFFSDTATFGDTTLNSAGDWDISLAKYSVNGNLLWVQQAGGTSDDMGTGVVLDDDGNSIVTGYFSDTATFGDTTLICAGIRDIFVAKCDNNGNWLWTVQAGGMGEDVGAGIVINGSSTVLTGWFEGTAIFGDTTLTSAGWGDIFIAKLSGVVTSVEPSGQIVATPTAFVLYANYPNPFNPVTQIKYALPKDCYVKLEVYNILGQKVATLVERKQATGYRIANWDASSFSSGIYFYRLEAGDFVQTRKMVLLK